MKTTEENQDQKFRYTVVFYSLGLDYTYSSSYAAWEGEEAMEEARYWQSRIESTSMVLVLVEEAGMYLQ